LFDLSDKYNPEFYFSWGGTSKPRLFQAHIPSSDKIF
jgi:hypothetical protein